MFFSVRNNKTQQTKTLTDKYQTRLGEMIILSPAKARKLSILPTSLDIFDIRQQYIRILYLCSVKRDLWHLRKLSNLVNLHGLTWA